MGSVYYKVPVRQGKKATNNSVCGISGPHGGTGVCARDHVLPPRHCALSRLARVQIWKGGVSHFSLHGFGRGAARGGARARQIRFRKGPSGSFVALDDEDRPDPHTTLLRCLWVEDTFRRLGTPFKGISPPRYLGPGSMTPPPPIRILEIPDSLTRSPRTGWSLKTQVIYVFEKPIIRYDLVVGCKTRACSRLAQKQNPGPSLGPSLGVL